MSNIGTKLHDALSIADENEPNSPGAQALRVMSQIPNFVIDKELKQFFQKMPGKDNTSVIQESTLAMFKAGVAKLPYPELMIELWGSDNARFFFGISETEKFGEYKVIGMEYWCKYPDQRDTKNYNQPCLVDAPIKIEFQFSQNTGPGGEPEWLTKFSDIAEFKDERMNAAISHAIAAINVALIMSHMGELDREVIDPTKLNKHRERSGKVSINTHIIVRIGHVYDHAGRKIKITDANRRSMPIHMRAGHTKRQPHGKPWLEDPENAVAVARMSQAERDGSYHIIWIAPVLVNYEDGAPLPLPKPRIVKL